MLGALLPRAGSRDDLGAGTRPRRSCAPLPSSAGRQARRGRAAVAGRLDRARRPRRGFSTCWRCSAETKALARLRDQAATLFRARPPARHLCGSAELRHLAAHIVGWATHSGGHCTDPADSCRARIAREVRTSSRARSWTPRRAKTKSGHADRRRQQTGDFPVYDGHDRARRHRHRQALRPDRDVHLRPGLHLDRQLRSKITYIDGDEGILLYRGYPIEQLAEHGDFLETCYLLLYGELPTAGAEGRFRLSRHAPHDGARADEPVLPGLPARRASDGGDGRLGRRALGLLSRLHRHLGPAPAHDRLDPHDREDADARRHGLQIFDRPAVRLSEERARLRLELPAHVLRRAVRGVQGQSGAGARDGPHLHPARRPRAERLDLDGAARRLVRRQSVRLHRGGLRLPVGPGAWRRQRGGAQDAGRDRHGRPHPGIHQARQGQERSASA